MSKFQTWDRATLTKKGVKFRTKKGGAIDWDVKAGAQVIKKAKFKGYKVGLFGSEGVILKKIEK